MKLSLTVKTYKNGFLVQEFESLQKEALPVDYINNNQPAYLDNNSLILKNFDYKIDFIIRQNMLLTKKEYFNILRHLKNAAKLLHKCNHKNLPENIVPINQNKHDKTHVTYQLF